ncbi:MAG: carbohydrate ABC transporter permease [Anaerolineae bacterium]
MGTVAVHGTVPWWRRPAGREAVTFYICVLPWVITFIVFTAGPMIYSLFLSFTNWNFLSSPAFVGFENYARLFSDPLFSKSLANTAYYTFGSVPLITFVGLLVAILMNQKVWGITVFRTIYYIPAVAPVVAAAMLFRWVFDPNYGMLNQTLRLVGIRGPQWIYSMEWAIPSFILMSLWGVGGYMIIYLAGLQGVPTELYEAASIDGAGTLRKFFNVTIPMISPVIFFTLVSEIIGSFQVFTAALVMTNGGPNNASLFYVLYLYRNAFSYFKAGYGSALAWVLFVIIMAFTALVFRSGSAWVYYEGSLTKA